MWGGHDFTRDADGETVQFNWEGPPNGPKNPILRAQFHGHGADVNTAERIRNINGHLEYEP